MARKLFSALFLGGVALAGCSAQKTAAPTPIEQIPSPEFATKPQIFFVIDKSEQFWNSPIPDELELKHRTRLTLFEGSDLLALENALRDFNGREGRLLVFSGSRLLETAKKLAIFSHPSGRKSLYLDSAQKVSSETPSLSLDLSTPIKMLGSLCQQWHKTYQLVCQWDAAIPGVPTTPKLADKELALPIGFSPADSTAQNSETRLRLKIDWVQWLAQFLMTETRSELPQTWRTLNLQNGTLQLDVLNARPEMPGLKDLLQAERLKSL